MLYLRRGIEVTRIEVRKILNRRMNELLSQNTDGPGQQGFGLRN